MGPGRRHGGFALWRDVRSDLLRELAFSAREFTAEEAVRAGFVTRLADDPHGAAIVLARAIAARSPDAARAAKRMANLADEADAATILAAESAEQQALLGKPNQVEAVRAGMERRAPSFQD